MVLIMLWRPRGLLAFREPTLRLHKTRPPGGKTMQAEAAAAGEAAR
jgi:branched-chain amino acid transport system permease protein